MQNEQKKGFYRFPTLHNDNLIFTSEGDLWRVSVNGGMAERMTSHHGFKSHAKISPCGKFVAFSAKYEGMPEIYLMNVEGGLPKRLTYGINGAFVCNWTNDGKIIYRSFKDSKLPNSRLFVLNPETLEENIVELSRASDGVFDLDNNLYFTMLPFQGSQTKRYKGGLIEQLWKFDGKNEAVLLTGDFAGTSKNPMVYENRVYFLSDRTESMNIWSMNRDGQDLKQHSFHLEFDVRSAALHAGKIVYQHGADLWLYDINNNTNSVIDISLRSDFDHTREKWIDKPINYLTSYDLSPKGDQLLLTSRGKVFSVPAKSGRLIHAAGKAGVRYKNAKFMADGKDILALHDETAEFEFFKIALNPKNSEQQLTKNSEANIINGTPSLDGKKLIYSDKNRKVWLQNLESDAKILIKQSDYSESFDFAWSPDSRFVAFVMTANSNLVDQIFIYDTKECELFAATGERYDSYSPSWSVDGKWLYFVSDRHFKSLVESPWGARQPEPYYNKTGKIYALDLIGKQRSPFYEDDELFLAQKEKEKEDKTALENKSEDKKKEESKEVVVLINRTDLIQRVVELPIKPGRFYKLNNSAENLFFMEYLESETPTRNLNGVKITNLDVEKVVLIEDIDNYQLSADAKKLLIKKKENFFILDAKVEKIEKTDKFKVDLSKWAFSVEPVKEWRQIFFDSWRMERDYFYDIDLHGVNYDEMLKIHEPLLERVRDRSELDDLICMMVGELSALHTFVGGGDLPAGKDMINIGCIGAKLNLQNGNWLIEHIYQTEPELPSELSPLLQNHLNIQENDILVAIDGLLLSPTVNPYSLLRNKVECQVHLTLQRGEEIIEVIIKTITPANEVSLRYAEWQYQNRLKVDRDGKNELGYVHLRAMGNANMSEWTHNFYPIFDRKGLIIDVRNNNGGNIDSWILEKLLRKAWFYWQSRDGKPTWNMQYAFRGHVVVLCNEQTASDGEAFAEGIRRLNIGKVIGMRTWGGEIWLSMNNLLVDNGIASAAQLGVFGPEGEWLIEGHGVVPDIEVQNPPFATFHGQDNQLDFAVKYLQQKISEEPVEPPKAPKFPKKNR